MTGSSDARLAVFFQNEDERKQLDSFRFRDHGFEAFVRPFSASSFAQVLSVLQEERPVACFSLATGVGAELLRLASKLAAVPVFSVVESLQDVAGLPIGETGTPQFYFLASTDVLTRALTDPRYGRTLIPTGYPAQDENASERMLGFMRAVRDGSAVDEPLQLSVVVPAFREAGNLDLVCDRLLSAFEKESIRMEILLIDDSSPDATYEVALRQMWKSPRIRAFTKPTPRGLGNAVRYGIDRARASVVVVTMGDGSDQVERIPDMYRKVADEGYGLVIGSRYRAKENYEAIPLLYRFWSRCFRLTAWAVVGLRLSDYTNAFRAFDRRIFARYGAESGGFELSPEITFKAWFATKRVGELDVKHLKRASGQSAFSFLRAGPGYGKILIKAFVNRLTGRWFTLDW